MAVLRIHDGGFLRAEAEEIGVEAVEVVEDYAGFHVARVRELLLRYAGLEQLLVAEDAHRFDAAFEVRPELSCVRRTGKPQSHPHDGDIAVVLTVRHGAPSAARDPS